MFADRTDASYQMENEPRLRGVLRASSGFDWGLISLNDVSITASTKATDLGEIAFISMKRGQERAPAYMDPMPFVDYYRCGFTGSIIFSSVNEEACEEKGFNIFLFGCNEYDMVSMQALRVVRLFETNDDPVTKLVPGRIYRYRAERVLPWQKVGGDPEEYGLC